MGARSTAFANANFSASAASPVIETTDTTIIRPLAMLCAFCAAPYLWDRVPGRPPKYCGPRCKQAAKTRWRPMARSLSQLPPRARETWLAVDAYRREHPDCRSVQAACDALGMNSATWGNARRMLYGHGVATDDEAFSCEDDDV